MVARPTPLGSYWLQETVLLSMMTSLTHRSRAGLPVEPMSVSAICAMTGLGLRLCVPPRPLASVGPTVRLLKPALPVCTSHTRQTHWSLGIAVDEVLMTLATVLLVSNEALMR